MNAEFNVWLLIVGLVVGAGLVWLVIMDSRRRESEIDEVERPREAAWLSAVLAEDGFDVSADAAERLLVLHRAYLDAPPPDGVMGEMDRSDEPKAAGEMVGTDGEVPWSAAAESAPAESAPAESAPAESAVADEDRVRVDGGG